MSRFNRGALGCALSAAVSMVAGGAARGQEMTEEKLRQQVVDERLKALEDKLSASDTFKVYWKDGLRLTTPDNKFDLKIGGRIHFESEWNHADDDLEQTNRWDGNANAVANKAKIGTLEDGYEIRRARLYLAGTLYQHVEFKWQFDLAKGEVQHKDVYVGLIDLGDWIPNIRAGHQYEQFGLDALTSSNDSTFVERAAISNVFAPNRNPGFQLWKNFKFDNVERITWAVGAYRNDSSDNSIATGDGAYDFTARITGTPWWVDGGKKFIHVGLAAMRRALPGKSVSSTTYAGKPEVDLFPNFVSTGKIVGADVDWRYGAELAAVYKRYSLQGEYMMTRTKVAKDVGVTLDDVRFSGWYAQASYMISGETRRYKTAEAIFQNPKPNANAFENDALGAWEAALRFSNIDLNDGSAPTGVKGGRLNSVTVGLNWYLNPNMRVMWDVSRIDLGGVDPALGRGGKATVAQMRVQLAF